MILLLGAIICLYIGETSVWSANFLASHFDGIITKSMLVLWFSLLIVSIFIILMIALMEHFHQHKFMLDEHSFHIRKGIFMIREKVIPYRHIQNVDIEQPYHYRIFGVARLNITTARMDTFDQNMDGIINDKDMKRKKKKSHEDVHAKNNLIPLIDKKIARELADFLLSKGGE